LAGRLITTLTQAASKLLQKLLLLATEINRSLDHGATQQVTDRPTPDRLNTFAAQAEQLTRLRFSWNAELHPPVKGWDLMFATQSSISKANGELAIQVSTIAFKQGVLFNRNLNV
jgi:hypothetical protein